MGKPVNRFSYTIYSPGTYQVTALDALGCSASSSINVPNITTFDITTSETLCQGSSIYLQSVNGLNSYLWNTGETSSAISINEGGMYSVSATDNNGCNLYDEISVESVVSQQVEIEYDNDSMTVCLNSSLDLYLSSDSDFTNIVWNNNSRNKLSSNI